MGQNFCAYGNWALGSAFEFQKKAQNPNEATKMRGYIMASALKMLCIFVPVNST
jgi:hypothetical protein